MPVKSASRVDPRRIAKGIYRQSKAIRTVYRALRTQIARQVLKRRAKQTPCRVVIGANSKSQEGWIPTEAYSLDITDALSWQRYFEDSSIDALLAEHVWEHLAPDDAIKAATLCRQYLRPGGHLRVAVPDGYFPDPGYLDYVRPGGTGPSADDHRVLFTHGTFAAVFEAAGFTVELLEYYDADSNFHAVEWDSSDGLIQRSKPFYKGKRFGGLPYTSIILDAKKT